MDLMRLKKIKGKKWIVLYIFYNINFIFFILEIILLEPYWGEINLVFSGWVDIKINIVLIVALITILPLIYGAILLTLKTRKIIEKNEIKPHLVNIILPILLLVIYNALYLVLLDLLEDYKYVIFQVLEFYSIFFYLALDIGLILLLIPLVRFVPRIKDVVSERFLKREIKTKITIIIFILAYISSFTLPFFKVPANILYGSLPDKPLLIAHRGASHLAPENTLKSAEMALKYDEVIGLEMDVQISLDGVPFLMHDDDLKRTTNVESVFPEKEDQRACFFNISELKQLDAGSWFADEDPYGTITSGIVSKIEAESYRGIKIPTLEEILNFSRDHGLFVDLDLKGIPSTHPYYSDSKEIILNVTLKSGIDLNKVMISTQDSSFINLIKQLNATAIILGYSGSPTIQEFRAAPYNYSYINTADSYSNDEYRALNAADIKVMVWTIDSTERYCELWCLGVDWVKTNVPYKFNDLQNPIIYLSIEIYYTIWFSLIASAIVLTIFLIRRKKL